MNIVSTICEGGCSSLSSTPMKRRRHQEVCPTLQAHEDEASSRVIVCVCLWQGERGEREMTVQRQRR